MARNAEEEEELLGSSSSRFAPDEMTGGPDGQSPWEDLPVYDTIHR